MVGPVSIGIIGIQGAIAEHQLMLRKLNEDVDPDDRCDIHVIRRSCELDLVNGIILPGGESTTISRFLERKGLLRIIKKRVQNHSLAVMGTCAGCVILAKSLVDADKDVSLLQLMNMQVHRNAFGRQRQSFEQSLDIALIGSSFPAVFIRAPIITKVQGSCRLLASVNGKGVIAKQDNCLALSFHPELTQDVRVHEFFFNMVKQLPIVKQEK